MVKRGIVLLLFLCLLPIFAFADSGPSQFYDKNDRLTFSVSTDQTEVAIGETLNFTLVLRNRTNDTITMSNNTESPGIWCPHEPASIDIDLGGVVVPAGKRVTIDISYPVTDTVKWYAKDGEYYMDIDLTLNYETVSDFTYGDELYRDAYTYFEKVQAKPIPIKITNLYDGSNYIDFNLRTNRDVFDVWDSYSWYENVQNIEYAYITNTISVTNISDEELSDFSFYDSYEGDIMEESFDLYKQDQCFVSTSNQYRYRKMSEVPDHLDAVYRAKFNIDGKFYAIEERIPCGVFCPYTPEIESRLEQTDSDTAGYIDYTIYLKNKSDRTLFGFYMVEGYDRFQVFDSENYLGDFESGQLIEKTFTIKAEDPVEIYWGSEANYSIRFFGEYILYGGEKVDFTVYGGNYREPLDIDSAEYSSKTVYVPAKKHSEQTPTTTATAELKATVAPIQITAEDVEIESGIPIWVRYVIPLAFAFAVGAALVLRKKAK